MNDTPKEVQDLFRTLLMQRSGEERLKMGCDMFSTSRALIRSSLEGKGLSETEMAVQIFLRTYGNDFPPETLVKITNWIRAQRTQKLGIRRTNTI